jgi:hypothetical protein
MADNESKAEAQAREAAGVAKPEDNAELKHTVELEGDEKGATTTRKDVLDQGVPMLQGSPSEPQGPEDAFGPGEKRGDYQQRVGAAVGMAESFESVPDPDGGEPITDDDGNVVDHTPRFKLVPQTPRTADIGDVEGEKGGVTTTT